MGGQFSACSISLFLSASQIWLDKRGGLWLEESNKRGTTVWLDKRGGLWWKGWRSLIRGKTTVWPDKRGGL